VAFKNLSKNIMYLKKMREQEQGGGREKGESEQERE
jgi:hypothetical protein